MADGHNEGADDGQQGLYDPLFLAPDDFDDVLYLLDMNGGMDPAAPPLAAPEQNVPGPSGNNNLQEWPATSLDNSILSTASTHSALAAGPSIVAQDVGAGTSVTASTSSSSGAAHRQNALDCTGCQVLREVLHSNGLEATKLTIHGVAGVFHHAILEVYGIDPNGLATAMTHHSYVDFRGRDYVWVKHYLTDYAQQRAGSGYIVLHDSISAFQDALCTGMVCLAARADGHREAVENNNGGPQRVGAGAADAVQPPIIEKGKVNVPEAPGPSEPVANEQGQQKIRPAVKSALAIQRERASNLQLGDIAQYFHLPMAKAAKELRVCATVLKGTSRRLHIRRWPYRKVKSIDSQIAKLRRRGNGDPEAMREIQRLTDYRRKIYAGLE